MDDVLGVGRFQGQEVLPVGFFQGVDPAQVGVGKGSQGLGFGVEAAVPRRITGDRLG